MSKRSQRRIEHSQAIGDESSYYRVRTRVSHFGADVKVGMGK